MSEIIEDNLVENDSIGTENNPYLISDKESLCAIQNNLAAHYKLIQDIDLGEEVFAPIGIFTGVLDGAGHSIKN